MSLGSWRARWRERRLDLAMRQIQSPADQPTDDGRTGGPLNVQESRAAFGAFGRLTRATSRTEWKGD